MASRNRVFVVGVGMTKFEKPGSREGWDYPDMAREAGTKALAGRGHRRTTEVEQGYVGYCYGDSTVRAARALRARHDRHPDRQRQQQLLDRLDGALPRRSSSIRGGLADCVLALGFEKMEKGSLGVGTTTASRRWASTSRRWPRSTSSRLPAGAVDVRQRRPRAHGAVRHHRRAVREDRLQEPQALGQQPVRAVPGRVHARRHPGRAGWSTIR